jgi:hypothetical protein
MLFAHVGDYNQNKEILNTLYFMSFVTQPTNAQC